MQYQRIIFEFLSECPYHTLIGDGDCNDESNNEECNYDGGDCCGSCIVTNLCSECSCLGNVTGNGETSRSIGDGICNDETNTLECNFDGNDCCRHPTITEFCVNCTCIDGELKNWYLNKLFVL